MMIYKEVVVAYLKVLFRNLHEETEENFSYDIR
jgi:hypothetical protein